jgi:hypothetical protein
LVIWENGRGTIKDRVKNNGKALTKVELKSTKGKINTTATLLPMK